MVVRVSAFILDLRKLSVHCELLRPTCESIAAAASVKLEALHGRSQRYPARLSVKASARDGTIVRTKVDDKARKTYDDPEEATEEGAEAIGVLVARTVLDRIVFARLPKRTGADYKMRRPSASGSDDYERLECSGIGEGKESAKSRLKEKLEQLATYSEQRDGHAVVTHFGREPIQILVGRHRR